MTSREIRQQFLDFFKTKDHTIVPSASLVPADDPTLMFTNAGMNQFKDVFLGTGSRPYTRVADTQKCIRAGGKHNDLDDVGQDTYHHTLFEMLGNWSFGDYFKKEAIEWAWELLTDVWGIEKDRLYASYFEGDESEGLEPDDEAARLWKDMTDIDPSHIVPGNKKDNFWEMGDTGPCGPCSEIHIDLTPDKTGGPLVNAGDHRAIEIWNLVFIQYNRAADGKLTNLPAKHVDTGMGFERLCAVLQGMAQGKLGQVSNYDTDVFTPIFDAIREITGAPPYTGLLPQEGSRDQGIEGSREGAGSAPSIPQLMTDISYRVIADHARCLTFAINDGCMPDRGDRGSVLRRIVRRAVRYAWQYLNMHEPFLYKLDPAVVDSLGNAFPQLKQKPDEIAKIIRDEEESFDRTLERGIALFEEWVQTVKRIASDDYVTENELTDSPTPALLAAGEWIHPKEVALFKRAGKNVIPGEAAFRLHDTYGFPIDLTQMMARERGLHVDTCEFERLMEEARAKARGAERAASTTILEQWHPQAVPPCDESPKYGISLNCRATVMMIHSQFQNIEEGAEVVVMTDRTCFYAEQGGQVSDTGTLSTETGEIRITSVGRALGNVAHVGVVTKGTVKVPQSCELRVDPRRSSTMQNHTATHILNWALREVLGDGVQQKGSLVDPEKTRFDFSHNKPVTPEQLERVEALANQQIEANHPVFTQEVDQTKALRIRTLRAVFGEQYPERVRVVSIGAPIGDEDNPAPDTLLGSPDDPKWMKHPVEFCGGTHLSNSGQAERFVLISEEGVAKGVRRVVGLSGEAAREAEATGAELLEKTDALLTAAGRDHTFPSRARKEADLNAELASLQRTINESVIPVVVRHKLADKLAELRRIAKKEAKQRSADSGRSAMEQVAALLDSAETVNGVTIVVGQIDDAPAEALRGAIDWVRNKTQASAVLLASVSGAKVTLVAGMSKDAVDRGLKAGDLVRQIAPIVNGSGGGKPTLAQAGGKNPDALPEALEKAKALLREWLR